MHELHMRRYKGLVQKLHGTTEFEGGQGGRAIREGVDINSPLAVWGGGRGGGAVYDVVTAILAFERKQVWGVLEIEGVPSVRCV